MAWCALPEKVRVVCGRQCGEKPKPSAFWVYRQVIEELTFLIFAIRSPGTTVDPTSYLSFGISVVIIP